MRRSVTLAPAKPQIAVRGGGVNTRTAHVGRVTYVRFVACANPALTTMCKASRMARLTCMTIPAMIRPALAAPLALYALAACGSETGNGVMTPAHAAAVERCTTRYTARGLATARASRLCHCTVARLRAERLNPADPVRADRVQGVRQWCATQTGVTAGAATPVSRENRKWS